MAAPLPPGFQIDPALSAQYGSPVAVNAEGKKIRWNDGSTPTGSKARPEFGVGAYETPDGSILKTGKSGNVQVLRGSQTAGADSRTRLDLGLGPAVQAQISMYDAERNGAATDTRTNPNDSPQGIVYNWLADGDPSHPIRNMVGKGIGGDRLQKYKQASSSFEAAFLPILSGSAVTPSEASRQIKANLPEPGDSPEILSRKSKNRAMMINSAAKLLGQPLPFPRLGTMPLPMGDGQSSGAGGASPTLTIDINGNVLK